MRATLIQLKDVCNDVIGAPRLRILSYLRPTTSTAAAMIGCSPQQPYHQLSMSVSLVLIIVNTHVTGTCHDHFNIICSSTGTSKLGIILFSLKYDLINTSF